ncbi:hypothetical protein Rs2_40872 [Raphanus sativus]|nr:hypothetical protein Rs2_40872 [Raphanus sativus]
MAWDNYTSSMDRCSNESVYDWAESSRKRLETHETSQSLSSVHQLIELVSQRLDKHDTFHSQQNGHTGNRLIGYDQSNLFSQKEYDLCNKLEIYGEPVFAIYVDEYIILEFEVCWSNDQILKRDSVERASIFFSQHGRAQEKCEEPLDLDRRDNLFHLRANNPYKDLVFDSNDENNDLLKEMDGAPIIDVYDDADPTLNVFHKENNIGGIQNVKEWTLGPSERVMIDGVCPDHGYSTNFLYHSDNWFRGSDKYSVKVFVRCVMQSC